MFWCISRVLQIINSFFNARRVTCKHRFSLKPIFPVTSRSDYKQVLIKSRDGTCAFFILFLQAQAIGLKESIEYRRLNRQELHEMVGSIILGLFITKKILSSMLINRGYCNGPTER